MIGLPDDATLYYAPATGRTGKLAMIFDQFLARTTGTLPVDSTIPRLYLTPDDPEHDSITVLFLAWDFATPDRSAIARYTWRASDPHREALLIVEGWIHVPNTITEGLLTASRTFIDEQRRGRRPGRKYSPEDIQAAYRTFHDEHGWCPDQTQIASALGIAPTTVRRIIGQPWQEFERTARRKLRSRTVRAKQP